MYVNQNSSAFCKYLANNLFVDKSKLILHLNQLLDSDAAFVCVTRPRRFGKSLALNMLNAYYSKGSDAKNLFEQKEVSKNIILKASTSDQFKSELVPITLAEAKKQELKEKHNDLQNISIIEEDYTKHLNKYDVICIDFNDLVREYKEELESEGSFVKKENQSLIQYLKKEIIDEFKTQYPDVIPQDYKYQLKKTLQILAHQKSCRFIVLIDEWDVVFRDPPYCFDDKLKNEYVEFLSGLFKDHQTMECISLAYITGILPIQKYYSESSLNNFTEYSMLSPGDLAPYYGFTKEEVQRLCKENDVDLDELTRWYDGYIIKDQHIYNPYSVVNAIKKNEFSYYWTKTSASDLAFNYVFGQTPLLDAEGNNCSQLAQDQIIELLAGKEIFANLSSFSGNPQQIATIDHLFSLFVCLGYLTYEKLGKLGLAKCRIFIPNLEVKKALKDEFLIHQYANKSQHQRIHALKEKSERFFKAIKDQNEQEIANLAQEFHNDSSSFVSHYEYNDESALRFTIQLLLLFVTIDYYQIEKEASSGKGLADLIYIPIAQDLEFPPMVIEFKMNCLSAQAIEQIKTKNYKQKLRLLTSDPIYYVGISYDQRSKLHECSIEIDRLIETDI